MKLTDNLGGARHSPQGTEKCWWEVEPTSFHSSNSCGASIHQGVHICCLGGPWIPPEVQVQYQGRLFYIHMTAKRPGGVGQI